MELAGTWYPATADACRTQLAAWVPKPETMTGRLLGGMVPHAGWSITGGLSYGVLYRLCRSCPSPARVVLLGGHLDARDACRVFIGSGFETPFGPLENDVSLSEEAAMMFDAEPESDEEYYDDNALEPLFPMIKALWPDAKVLTLAFPPVSEASKWGADLGHRLRSLPDPSILVCSHDLTHYGPEHGFVPQGRGQRASRWVLTENDPSILDLIRNLSASRIVWTATRQRNACGAGSLAGALGALRILGAERTEVFDHTTSWMLRGDEEVPASFVSYACALFAAEESQLSTSPL